MGKPAGVIYRYADTRFSIIYRDRQRRLSVALVLP